MTIQDEEVGTKQYTWELEGNTLLASREDPYGLFRLSLAKGKLPEKYQGLYTSTYEIEKMLTEMRADLKQTASKEK